MSKWNKVKKLSIIANVFVAVSMTGLSILGFVSNGMAIGTVVGSVAILGAIGLVGRFINQDLKDDGKMFWDEGK